MEDQRYQNPGETMLLSEFPQLVVVTLLSSLQGRQLSQSLSSTRSLEVLLRPTSRSLNITVVETGHGRVEPVFKSLI